MENQQQPYTTATVEGPSAMGIVADAVDEEQLAVLQQVSVSH